MKKGFTLVEILVAVTIFVTILTVASSLFISAVRGQRRNLAYQELLDQTSYAMEYMSRSIRMAIKDDIESGGVTLDCLTDDKVNYEFDGSCLIFRNYKNECQYFCLQGAILVTATTTPPGPPVSFNDLTSPELQISALGPQWIELFGREQGDNLQPLVTISLEVEGREEVKVGIQTSVSQRNLDVTK